MALFDITSGIPWGSSKEWQNYTIWRTEFPLTQVCLRPLKVEHRVVRYIFHEGKCTYIYWRCTPLNVVSVTPRSPILSWYFVTTKLTIMRLSRDPVLGKYWSVVFPKGKARDNKSIVCRIQSSIIANLSLLGEGNPKGSPPSDREALWTLEMYLRKYLSVLN